VNYNPNINSGPGADAAAGAGPFGPGPSGGGSSGLTLISSGKITTPADDLVLLLDTSFDAFIMRSWNWLFTIPDDFDFLVYQLSDDGGSTFHSGASDYLKLMREYFGPAGTTGQNYLDAYGYIANSIDLAQNSFTTEIVPGTAATSAIVESKGFYYEDTETPIEKGAVLSWQGSQFMTNGRQNAIKFEAFTEGNQIASVNYILWGITL